VSLAGCLVLASASELVERVFLNRFQKPIADLILSPPIGQHQALVRQRGQRIQDCRTVRPIVRHLRFKRLDGLQRKATRKHPYVAEERLFRFS
jgi:hypothetical protein